MISNFNLDFLYYQSPEEYWYRLDGDPDPKLTEISNAGIKFEDYLSTCSLSDYVITIISAFKEIYPHLLHYYIKEGEFSIYNTPGRIKREIADIVGIEVNYKDVIEGDDFESYLASLIIEFKESQPQLKAWVAKGLENKQFVVEARGDTTTIQVADSPIATILIKNKAIEIHIDKKSYIRYHTF